MEQAHDLRVHRDLLSRGFHLDPIDVPCPDEPAFPERPDMVSCRKRDLRLLLNLVTARGGHAGL